MRFFILYIYNIIAPLIPETHLFGFKRFLLKQAGLKIGNNVRISSSARFLGNGIIEIGDNTWIGPQCLIISSAPSAISIGRNVDIAPRVYIGNGSHEIDPLGKHSAGKGITGNIIIEDGVWIGTSCTILLNVTVGHKSVIAASSLVNKDISPKIIGGGYALQAHTRLKIATPYPRHRLIHIDPNHLLLASC